VVRNLIAEELVKVKASVTSSGASDTSTYERAAKIFEQMSTSKDFSEFLTLPLYEELA